MVYLISYDINEKTKTDETKVLARLRTIGAVQCLYSEWLVDSPHTALAIANHIWEVMSADDGLLVVGISSSAYANLRHRAESVGLLKAAA